MRSLKALFRTSVVLVVLLSIASCSAQAKSTAALRVAAPSDVKASHLNYGSSLLPADTRDVRFNDSQAVTVPGSPEMTVLPVSFKMPVKDAVVEGQMHSQCGVVLTPRDGPSTLLITVGEGNTEMMSCTGIKAIGGSPAVTGAGRPDLILIYDVYTGHESSRATVLLTWHQVVGTYTVNTALSQWLGEQKDGRTVAGTRRLLAQKRQHGTS